MTIEEYLIQTIDSLNDSLADEDIVRISEEMSQKLCEYNNYYGNRDEFNEIIYNLLYDYLYQIISKEELINSINYELDLFITGVDPLDELIDDDLFIDENEEMIDDSLFYDDSADYSYDDNSYDVTNDYSYYDDTSNSTSYASPSNYSYNNATSTNYTYQPSSSSTQNNSSVSNINQTTNESYDITVDITIEEMDFAAPKYEEIEKVISGSSITGTISLNTVQTEIKEINTLLTQSKKDVGDYLEKIKKILIELFDKVAGIDSEAFEPEFYDDTIIDGKEEYVEYEPTPSELDFNDISQMTASWKSKSSIQRVDSTVFESLGYQVDSNGIVTINNCEYNTTNGKLTNMSNGNSIYVSYYIPKDFMNNSDKLSMANTITCLSAPGEQTIGDNFGYGTIANYKSDAIIVIPSKAHLVDNDSSYSERIDAVMDSTSFATIFSNQKPGCRNIIGGCSTGGSSALKAAANYDIYDTAFSINYPALVPGVAADEGLFIDHLTEVETANLSNKTILLIESGGDGNLRPTEESVRVLSRDNPNVYYATNGRVTDIGDAHLLDWSTFAQNYGGTSLGVNDFGDYSGHPAYHGLMADVINSGMFNYNDYNSPTNG